MTSTVKYYDDARTGRAVGSWWAARDVVPAALIGTDAVGDIEIAPPVAIVDCEPSTALGFGGAWRAARQARLFRVASW